MTLLLSWITYIVIRVAPDPIHNNLPAYLTWLFALKLTHHQETFLHTYPSLHDYKIQFHTRQACVGTLNSPANLITFT